MRAAGLEDRVTVLLQDYRDLRGRYDKLVSIEMIEAVGWEHLDTLLRARAASCWSRDGAMLLQAIVHPHRVFRVEKASTGFINALVFPGGSLPSLRAIERSLARRTDLRTVALDDITPHYARTLALLAHALPRRLAASCARSATTSASAACGTSTSPTAKPASASAASPTSSSCSPSPPTAPRRSRR